VAVFPHLWATNNYSELGESYAFSSPILPELITGINGNIEGMIKGM